MKLVSVIITAYNRNEFIVDAIQSVLSNSFESDKYEVIVITNFPIPSFDLHSVVLKHFMMEGTVGEFLKKGVLESSGEVICFLDDDDMFLPDKIKAVYNEFEKSESLMYFHNSQIYIDDFKSPIKNFKLHSEFTKDLEFKSKCFDKILNEMRKRDVNSDFMMFNLSSISVRRSALLKGIRLLEKIKGLTDVAVFIISISSEESALLRLDTRKLTFYRYHESSSNFPSWNMDKRMREKRLEFYSLSTSHWLLFYSFSPLNFIKKYTYARYNYCNSVVSVLIKDRKGIILSLFNLLLLRQLQFSEPTLKKRVRTYLGLMRELTRAFSSRKT